MRNFAEPIEIIVKLLFFTISKYKCRLVMPLQWLVIGQKTNLAQLITYGFYLSCRAARLEINKTVSRNHLQFGFLLY